MNTPEIITDAESGCRFLEAVIEATNSNSNALGFLPKGVYREALSSGNLWILAEGERYCGHLLFGGAHPILQIKQLYIIEDMRGRGLARSFIDKIVRHGETKGYTAIRARVAADLEANHAWERLGFATLQTSAGGQTTRRQINSRYRQLQPRGPQTHMFETLDACVRSSNLVARGMPINRDHWYTLDLNVWLDFFRQRPPFCDAARTLIEEASRGAFRLRFTHEAKEEARRTSGNREHDPLLAVVETWQAIGEEECDELDELVERLRLLIFPERSSSAHHAINDTSDLRHLAMSIRANASGFITRDRAILRQRPSLWQRFGFHVLAPSDLLEPRDQRAPPRSPLQADLKVQQIGQRWADIAKQVECAIRGGARLRAVDREDEGWVCSMADRIVGIIFWKRVPRGDIEAFLLLENDDALEARARQRVFDVLLGLLTAEARSAMILHRLFLRADMDSCEQYRDDLCRVGFFVTRDRDRFVRFMSGDLLLLDDWQKAKTVVESELGVQSDWLGNLDSGQVLRLRQDQDRWIHFDRFHFETYFGITALTLEGRTAFYIPIREGFANELLPRPTRPELFNTYDASLRVERVYFRKARAAKILSPGDLLFFYVSSPIKAVIGVARCTASEELEAEEAAERFLRLAVLDPRKVGSVVHCIAFDNYIHFRNRVDQQWMEKHGMLPPQNIISLVKVPGSESHIELLREGLRRSK